MAKKRIAKKIEKVSNIKSVEYNKLIKSYNEQKRKLNNQGVRVLNKYPSYKEFKQLPQNKKLNIVKGIERDTKTLRSAKVNTQKQRQELKSKGFNIKLKGDKQVLAKSKERELKELNKERIKQQRIREREEAKRIEEQARAFVRQQRELERKRRREKAVEDKIKREKEKELSLKTKKQVETDIKSRSNFFRKYSYSKYKSSVNRLAQDAARYGIKINKDITPEQLQEYMKDPSNIEKIKRVQDTKRLSNRFTSREDVLTTIKSLGLEVESIDNRSKAISYEELEKYKRLRRKYNEKRNIFNKYNKSKNELKKADSIEDYLLKSEEERKKVIESMSKVSSKFNSTIKKTADTVDSKVRKELKENELLEEKESKKLDTSEENKFKLKLKLSSEEDVKSQVYVDMFEVAENKSPYINLYNERGLQTNKEPINILSDLSDEEMEQIDEQLEKLGINVDDFYNDIVNNIDSDEELEDEEKEELIEKAKDHLDDKYEKEKEVVIVLPDSDGEVTADDLDDLLDLDSTIEDLSNEEEDIEELKKQKRFEKPKFESTSYVWDDNMDNYSNFLNKLRRDDNGLNDWQIKQLGIDLYRLFRDRASKLGVSGVSLLKQFFNSLDISDIEKYIPSRWDYESGDTREFYFLNNSLNEMIQEIREDLDSFISEED